MRLIQKHQGFTNARALRGKGERIYQFLVYQEPGEEVEVYSDLVSIHPHIAERFSLDHRYIRGGGAINLTLDKTLHVICVSCEFGPVPREATAQIGELFFEGMKKSKVPVKKLEVITSKIKLVA